MLLTFGASFFFFLNITYNKGNTEQMLLLLTVSYEYAH